MAQEHQTVTDFPFAMAIFHLVVGRMGREPNAYKEHTPTALSAVQEQELATVMKSETLRQDAESRFGVFFAFREPNAVAAARLKDDPRLRTFAAGETHGRAAP